MYFIIMGFFSMCEIIKKNISLLCAHVAAKFRDDLLIGTEHSYKILPECSTPQNHFIQRKSIVELNNEEKREIVIADPKFGMFSLFKYHITRGYNNEILKQKNAVYCSHIFSLLSFLPIIVFVSQWAMYIGILYDQYQHSQGEWCPNQSDWGHKLVMFGVSGLYFVKSFFLWDNLTDRTRLNKMIPAVDTWTMLDTFQEFGFNLFVYGANIWIVFNDESIGEMVLDCVAMEFLMTLDNEFEVQYFNYLPEAAVDIYDNVFVDYGKNFELVEKKKNNCSFYCLQCMTFIPFKILLFSLLLFPFFCLFMMIYGPLCK